MRDEAFGRCGCPSEVLDELCLPGWELGNNFFNSRGLDYVGIGDGDVGWVGGRDSVACVLYKDHRLDISFCRCVCCNRSLSFEGERESLFVDAFMLADCAAGAEAVADE